MTEDPIIRIDDMRRQGYCVRGIKQWMELAGFDFRDFLANGIPASQLLATGDELVIRVVRARKKADG